MFYYDISDNLPHFAICNKSKYFHSQRTNTHSYKRKETKNNFILLNQDLQNEFWEDVYNEYDAHKAYDIFLDELTYYYNKSIPLVRIPIVRASIHFSDWGAKVRKNSKWRAKLHDKVLRAERAAKLKIVYV